MKRFIDDYNGETFDVIVIGGGITGAAVAYDAATRGLSVALVEKSDFGGATSAATSKLIHGGLRYLATMEFGLVRESLRERKTMENIAPNFVYPIPLIVTTSNVKLTNRKLVIKAGMILYDIFSYDKGFTWDKSKRIPLHRTLTPEEVVREEPNVKSQGLTGAAVYYDCVSIFPERLTLAFIKSAVRHGAVVSNYTRVEDFIVNDGRVLGVRVKDILKNRVVDIKGRITVNCGGPWADIILGLAGKKGVGEQLRRSEGIHLITKKLVSKYIVTSVTPRGRHFFIIPWRGRSLIGTTDKEYIGNPDTYRVTGESIQELLDEVNESFGDGKLRYEDIHYTYGGLRPLVEDQTEDVYDSSRKYEIYDNRKDGLDGLITVEGGKYTTSRNLAQQVSKTICKKLKHKYGKTVTNRQYLAGSEIENMLGFIEKAVEDNKDIKRDTVEYLARHYGTEYGAVLDIARQKKMLAQPLNDEGEILAEVVFAIRHEMAETLNDIIFRRTGLGTRGDPGDRVLRAIAAVAASELGWNKQRIQKELTMARDALKVPRKGSSQKKKR